MIRNFVRCVGTSAVLISIISAGLGGIGQAAAGEASGITRADTSLASLTPSKPPFSLEQFRRGTGNALKEFGVARSDHAAIALGIGQCNYGKFGDPIHWSPTVRAILLFELDENLMHTLPYASGSEDDKLSAHEPPVLNAFHAAAISFSDRISRDRLVFRKELEDHRELSRWYQMLILGLGAGATIFVSLRAILDGNKGAASVVGVLAIIFSAAGVAVSSMNSFEGSQAIVLRDQRALSQLQQLHWRVASDVLKQHAICNDNAVPSDKAMEMVDSWRSRLETILDSAVESISKPGDLSNGGVTDQTAAGKNSQGNTTTARR